MQGTTTHKTLLLVLSLLIGSFVIAQDDFYIYGTVKQKSSNQKLESVTVQVYQDGKLFDTFTTSGNSKYEFEVPLGHKYEFKFDKAGFVNKKIEINTKNIPEEDQEGGFKLNMDMTLFDYVEGFDESILDEPLGIASYDPAMNDITFDIGHTSEMNNKIENELIRLEKAGEEDLANKKKFDKLMIQGSDNLTKDKFDEAVGSYKSALNLFPDNLEAQQKLKEAEDGLALQNADKERQAKYDALVEAGNDLMESKSYEDSKSKFLEASSLMPDESEPKDKIRELDDLIASMANQEQFDEFMSAGDSAMDAEEYQSAVDNYMSARDIIPSDKVVKKKITEAQEKLDALLAAADAEAAKEKRYNDLMAKADASFNSEDYALSITQYNAALEVKPDEDLPKSQIEEANKRIEALAEEAEADAANAAQASVDAEYQAFIDKANSAFIDEDFDTAKSNYQEALGVKPSDQYAKDRISRIDELMAEAAAEEAENAANDEQAALDAKYEGFLDKANSAFTSEDLENAKANYESALEVKPGEKFPAQRIKTINDRLAEKEAELLANNEQAELDAQREKELLAQREREKAEKEAAQEQERLRLEKELAEKERMAEEERKRKEDADKRRNLTNNIDEDAEKQAEEFYKQMKKTENQLKYDSLEMKKEQLKNSLDEKALAASELAKSENSNINTTKNEMKKLYADGENYQKDKRESFDSGAAKAKAADQENRYDADDRRKEDNFRLNELKQKDAEAKTEANKKTVKENALATNSARAEVEKAQKGYKDTGEVQRKDNIYEVDRDKAKVAEMLSDGDKERKKSEEINKKNKEARATFISENTQLNEEKLAVNLEKIEAAKSDAHDIVTEADDQRTGNVSDVEYQKEKRAEMLNSKEEETLLKSKINREEAFNLKKAEPKSYDDYIIPEGKEQLAEGVTERSYEIQDGRKLVIERTVKIGNKVDTYLKVIDKNATYYFKNNKSITKSSWARETLYAKD